MKIQNRTFIVSGGSSVLGLETVHELIELGAYVSILDRYPSSEGVDSSCVRFFQTDITSLPQLESAVDRTVAWTDETKAPLGGVINCAGIAVTANIIDIENGPHPLELWKQMIGVNLTGSFNLTRLVLKHLKVVEPDNGLNEERGVVVFVSSAAAYEGQSGFVAYSATKGALRSITLPMAIDLSQYSIRVVSIAPNFFETNLLKDMPAEARRIQMEGVMFPHRFGRPDEFAKTVRWILECSHVNGDTIRLSGGGRLPAKL